VITVALDSAGPVTAGEWIRAARPTHPALIDVHYEVAARYNMVNVPTAVWIDEQGRIVRPNEVAFADNRWIEYTKFDMTRYLAAIRDWVAKGPDSRYVLTLPSMPWPPPTSGSPSICIMPATPRRPSRSSRPRSGCTPSPGATSARPGR
jgi:hypothetical protein